MGCSVLDDFKLLQRCWICTYSSKLGVFQYTCNLWFIDSGKASGCEKVDCLLQVTQFLTLFCDIYLVEFLVIADTRGFCEGNPIECQGLEVYWRNALPGSFVV